MMERDFQTIFGKWLKAHFARSAAFELKSARGPSIAFDAVAPHQLAALLRAERGTLYHKIPDVGFQNPFDCVVLSRAEAYVVVRYPSGAWYAVDAEEWLRESGSSPRRSLTEPRAAEICSFRSP